MIIIRHLTIPKPLFDINRMLHSRYCNWVLSHTRSSLNGPWNCPAVNTTKSSSGVTCTITSVNSDGNWSVSLKSPGQENPS